MGYETVFHFMRAITRPIRKLLGGETEARRLFHFASRSRAAFDVICLPNSMDPLRFAPDALYLDRATLDALYVRCAGPLGAIKAFSGMRVSQKLARYVSAKLARKISAGSVYRERAFMTAWFIHILRELSVLMPARHLARHIARENTGRLILIPIESTRFVYLNLGWNIQPREIEPLVIAYALRKHGARVLLIMLDADVLNNIYLKNNLYIEFEPSGHLISGANPKYPNRKNASSMVHDNIRNGKSIELALGNPLTVTSWANYDPDHADIILWGRDDNPPMIILPLERCSEYRGRTAIFSVNADCHSLGQFFIEALARTSSAALANAELGVKLGAIERVHVCDCVSFHSAIVSHAVARAGGEVVLWPHSSNAVHVELREPGEIGEINCVTVSAARRWAQHLPDARCVVDSELMLRPCETPRPFVEGQPITVVLFGGAHRLARMPLLPQAEHELVWRKLVTALAAVPGDFRVVFKAKDPWENAAWLRTILDDSVPFEETSILANHIDLPNMIFLTVSMGSTALLEGLGRGIPCMIAREFAVEDYVDINPVSCLIGDVQKIVSELHRCRDKNYYNMMTKKELQWYSKETVFIDRR